MAETREEQIARWEREGHEPCGPCDFGVPAACTCPKNQAAADISVVDRDRLTRRNPDHLDDWRFR